MNTETDIKVLEGYLIQIKRVIEEDTFTSKRTLSSILGNPNLRAAQLVLFQRNILRFNENGKIIWYDKIPITFKLATTLYDDYVAKTKSLPGRKKKIETPKPQTKNIDIPTEEILSIGELHWTMEECKSCMRYSIAAMIISVIVCGVTIVITLT